MKTLMKVKNLEEIELTLTVTMKVKDWRALMQQQQSEWPGWKFGNAIASSIARVDLAILEETEVDPY